MLQFRQIVSRFIIRFDVIGKCLKPPVMQLWITVLMKLASILNSIVKSFFFGQNWQANTTTNTHPPPLSIPPQNCPCFSDNFQIIRPTPPIYHLTRNIPNKNRLCIEVHKKFIVWRIVLYRKKLLYSIYSLSSNFFLKYKIQKDKT